MLQILTNALLTDTSALHLRYQSTREKIFKEHSSLAVCRRQQTEPVDLDHCLRAFTSEEKLEQTYYCSHCKSKQPATKKLQLWKLPPILVRRSLFRFFHNLIALISLADCSLETIQLREQQMGEIAKGRKLSVR